jgi:hypothetical protein
MKEERDYIRDIVEMRSMMERSTRFLSLSGLAGVMAGIYALAGVFVAHSVFDFHPTEIDQSAGEVGGLSVDLVRVIMLAIFILVLAIGTAFFLSFRKARKRGEKPWNHTAKRLLINMAVPLVTGGLLILVFLAKGMTGLIVPSTLLFYGLGLYNASKFTYEEVRSLGLIEICLGLLSAYFVSYSLIFWAIGFGIVHIVYGIYMHYRYER